MSEPLTAADIPWGASVQPAEMPVDLAGVLDHVSAFIRRFVVLTPDQLAAVSLWIAHTHVFEASDCTPYLNVGSAEMGSGKTRLLEGPLKLLTRNAWFTGRCSAAVLVRKIAAECPTLLLDESDAQFNGPDEFAETLRGLLNVGYRRGGCHSLCVGQGANITYKDFPVFCPKAIAGLGNLPSTVRNRSIRIELKRRATHERIERFRERQASADAGPLAAALATWSQSGISERLRMMQPALPEALGDRQQDVWEPLLAIADIAGGEWPGRARAAAVGLSGSSDTEEQTLGVTLLRDMWAVFAEEARDTMASAEVVKALVALEDRPWASFGRSEKGLTPHQLARRLAPFGIAPAKLWIGAASKNGYAKRMFEDAWARYCADLVSGLSPSVATESPSNGTECTVQNPPLPPDRDFKVEGRKEPNKTGPELPFFKVEGGIGPSTLKTTISSITTGLPSDLPLQNPDRAEKSASAAVGDANPTDVFKVM